jgi:diguanylate cyclase (GGDEF)-like protein
MERIAAVARRQEFQPGEDIVEIGDPGRSLYLVLEGHVSVLYPALASDVELARLHGGDFFGEMALLNGKPRSATVRAIDKVEALVLDKEEFRRILIDTPQVAIELLEAMAVRIRNADEQISTLSAKAVRDPLTGLLNRRALDERLGQESERVRRYGSHFSLILLDIDALTVVNDTVGHDVADELLAWVGRILTEHTRAADVPFRLGGGEFAILCPVTEASLALTVVRRLAGVIAEAIPPIDHHITLTMSGGYASCPEDGQTAAQVYEAAYRALRAAKNDGPNQVFGSHEPTIA